MSIPEDVCPSCWAYLCKCGECPNCDRCYCFVEVVEYWTPEHD